MNGRLHVIESEKALSVVLSGKGKHDVSEAYIVQRHLEARAKILSILEDKSMNTYENLIFSKKNAAAPERSCYYS